MEQKKQLGTLLVENGLISAKTLERALERQRGSGAGLGQAGFKCRGVSSRRPRRAFGVKKDSAMQIPL